MASDLAPGVTFTPIAPQFLRVKVLAGTIAWMLPIVPLAVLSATVWRAYPWIWIGVGTLVVLAVWYLALLPRRVRAYGYAELPEELLVCRGLMFQHLDVVPYGRMQQVTVESGPIMGRYGLASVTLVTASASTNAEIPGMRREEAERLRERLTARAETDLEGL